jgi:hypothetical protein
VTQLDVIQLKLGIIQIFSELLYLLDLETKFMLVVVLNFRLFQSRLVGLLLQHVDFVLEVGSFIAHLLLELFNQVVVTFLGTASLFAHTLFQSRPLFFIECLQLCNGIFTLRIYLNNGFFMESVLLFKLTSEILDLITVIFSGFFKQLELLLFGRSSMR